MVMRNFITVLMISFVFVAVTLSGCGGGGGSDPTTTTPTTTPVIPMDGGNTSTVPNNSSSTTSTRPSLSNLSISKTSATLNEGGGVVTVTFNADFIDAGGDLVSMTLTTYDKNTNNQTSTKTFPISGVAGLTSGRVSGAVAVATTTIGTWDAKIYVTDNAGTSSNTLSTNWSVVALPTSTSVISTYMTTEYQLTASAYSADAVLLAHQLQAQGLSFGSTAITKYIDLKLSHIQNFVDTALAYVPTTKANYILDRAATKALFTTYKNKDVADITSYVNSAYTARAIDVNQTVLSSAVNSVKGYYDIALLTIDTM